MKFGCRNKDHSLIWAFSVIVKSLQTFVSSYTQQVTNPDTEQQTDMKQRHFHVARWHLIIKAISWVEQLHHLTEHDERCMCCRWGSLPYASYSYSWLVFLCTTFHFHFPFQMFWCSNILWRMHMELDTEMDMGSTWSLKWGQCMERKVCSGTSVHQSPVTCPNFRL